MLLILTLSNRCLQFDWQGYCDIFKRTCGANHRPYDQRNKQFTHRSISADVTIILLLLRWGPDEYENNHLFWCYFGSDTLSVSSDELSIVYKQFIASCHLIDVILDSPILSGSAKQKPLEYYMDNSNLIMLYLRVFEVHLKEKASNIDLNESNTLKDFSDAVKLSDDIQSCLDEFLLYTHFLKWSELMLS